MWTSPKAHSKPMTDRPQSYTMYSSDETFNERFEAWAGDFGSVSEALRHAAEVAMTDE